MKISGHKDARIFERYNIVDTRDVAEAVRKLSEYEQAKRLARQQQASLGSRGFTEGENEADKAVRPVTIN